jgi:hypothetical protein
LNLRVLGKAIALLVVYGTAFQLASAVYSVYRYSNVTRITVSKLSDFDEVFEVGPSSLRVKSPEFLKVCFAGDYVHALQDAQSWFASNETEFKSALEGAGTFADSFNNEGSSSIVLLSHTSAVIFELEPLAGFSVANTGCAGADHDIDLKKSRSDPGIEFWLRNPTLRSTDGR